MFRPGLLSGQKKGLIFLFVFSLIPAFLFCSPRGEITVRRKATMAYFGTVSQVVVYDNFSRKGALENWENCWNEITGLLADLETKLSAARPDGDIGRFNALSAGSSIAINKETAEVFILAKELYEISSAAFNPAVFLLTDLWGYSPRFMLPVQSRPIMPYDRTGGPTATLPDEKYIQAFARLADFNHCVLDIDSTGKPVLTKNGSDEIVDGQKYSLQIDFGGIGKGYAAEKAVEVLVRHGYKYGLVNIGSSSFQLLERYADKNDTSDAVFSDPGLWPVNIRSPFDRSATFLTAYGKNEGVSTSGTYEHNFIIEGRRYSHIIDSQTGYPVDGVIESASIIGPGAAWADAATTALCVMSSSEARQFLENHLQNYQVILILSDGSIISNTTRYHLIP